MVSIDAFEKRLGYDADVKEQVNNEYGVSCEDLYEQKLLHDLREYEETGIDIDGEEYELEIRRDEDGDVLQPYGSMFVVRLDE